MEKNATYLLTVVTNREGSSIDSQATVTMSEKITPHTKDVTTTTT